MSDTKQPNILEFDLQETLTENRLGSLLAMLEPLSTFMVGGIVLFIALSMFLPIYSGLDNPTGQ